MNGVFATEFDDRTAELRRRLDAFYESTETYEAFQATSDQGQFWAPIRDEIAARLDRGRAVRALEFGAGRTGFRAFLGDVGPRVTFHAQDVTGRHRAYLETQADEVFVGDVRDIRGQYDVIFSTFVWEHITTPRQVLDHLLALLAPGGTLFIASPRYDFPFYLSPSARHYPRARQVALGAWLAVQRLRARLGAPRFLIHTDPAVLHRPWFRDADAIHWASWWDLKRYVPGGFRVRRLQVRADGLLGRFWARYLLLFVRIDGDTAAPAAPATPAGPGR